MPSTSPKVIQDAAAMHRKGQAAPRKGHSSGSPEADRQPGGPEASRQIVVVAILVIVVVAILVIVVVAILVIVVVAILAKRPPKPRPAAGAKMQGSRAAHSVRAPEAQKPQRAEVRDPFSDLKAAFEPPGPLLGGKLGEGPWPSGERRGLEQPQPRRLRTDINDIFHHFD